MIRRRMIRRRWPERFAAAVLVLTGAAAIVGLAGCSGSSSALPTIPSATPTSLLTPDARPTGSGCPTGQPPPLPAGGTRTVEITTSLGMMTLEIDGSLAPIAAGNFVALAMCGFYDGVVFHRVATLPDGTPFVIQGGDPTGTGAGGPGYTIADETVTATYHRGTLAMARSAAPNSQGSQFFVVLSDAAGPTLASYNTYAIFGEVTVGMDVADAIYAAADAEIPTNPIAMDSVTVSDP
jgi:peptidyl-prolyl cis-trans isomerase B (cyclophilin B)